MEYKIHDSLLKWRNSLLGSLRQNSGGKGNMSPIDKLIFFTISPPAHAKVECLVSKDKKNKTVKIPYERLSLHNQKAFIDKYFQNVYSPHIQDYYYCYEINSNNNLHVHGFIYDPFIQSEYDMACFRDTINKHHQTLKYMKNVKLFKYFNCIVYCDEDGLTLNERSEYITKDLDDSIKHFGYTTDSNNDGSDITIPTLFVN